MNPKRWHCRRTAALAMSAAIFFSLPLAAHADEREDLEKLRATVLGLIDVLIKSGVLPRDKADTMMKEAEARANTRLAAAPLPVVGPDGKKIVRVAYVPEAVKTQMREQIKSEVLAEARNDLQAGMGTIDAASRFQIEGDLRLRAEHTYLDPANTAASALRNAEPDLTRAPDLFGSAGNGGVRNSNTQQDTERSRVRARVALLAKVSDEFTAGIGLATGNTSNPTSTSQTLGTSFNKYSLGIDRAFVRYEPSPLFSATGGRFRNPFFSTDLVWADDLNFEGVAMTLKPKFSNEVNGFFTAGWFPLASEVPNQTSGRSLLGLQGGFDMHLGQKENRLKFGTALYQYRGIEGIQETVSTHTTSPIPDYVTRSEYVTRQKGNTLFRLNAIDDTATNWGLASEFRELNLTAQLNVAQFDPMHVIVTGDIVKNLSFDRAAMAARSGRTITDGKALGYMGRVQVGSPQVARRGDWNVHFSYRYLGSDAVVDAFTNSDFGLGGTNNKGFILGGNYGIARNTWLSARWLSSDLIDSMVPANTTTNLNTKYSVDVLQLDLNTRF